MRGKLCFWKLARGYAADGSGRLISLALLGACGLCRNAACLPPFSKGKQREVNRIVMVFEVEDLRETSSGELVFVPSSLGVLRFE